MGATGDAVWATEHSGLLAHKPRGAPRPAAEFWAGVEEILEGRAALRSPFVLGVAAGTAPRAALARFATDLVFLSGELPLAEGIAAAHATWHGVETVTMLSHGMAVATGFCGEPELRNLALDLAVALGVDREAAAAHVPELGSPTAMFATVFAGFAEFSLEVGVAATMVDAQWEGLARRLQEGLATHYGLEPADLRVFDALARFDGPRTEHRPRLLAELAGSGYHQHVIDRAVREIALMWEHMWAAWGTTTESGGA